MNNHFYDRGFIQISGGTSYKKSIPKSVNISYKVAPHIKDLLDKLPYAMFKRMELRNIYNHSADLLENNNEKILSSQFRKWAADLNMEINGEIFYKIRLPLNIEVY